MELKFTKAKLSHDALDAFVKKYSTNEFGDAIPYTTKSGEVMPFSSAKMARVTFSQNEFCYFLAQTVPFHETESSRSFPISQLAYIMNENGKPELWTRNSKTLLDFILLGNKIRLIPLE